MLVSVIIPVYNEEKAIADCLQSLASQTYHPFEIIVVDDGSADGTVRIIGNWKLEIGNLILLKQNHLGPGLARNLGASRAKGEILVFVDADMTFDQDFIKDLVGPILKGQTIGTFSKNEMVANKKNLWSICWNINRNVPPDRMLPVNYPDEAPVFRAILKKEFDKVGGFDTTGEYTDDWSLSQKLKVKSTLAPGAVYYHSNPSTLSEVWHQARWIGKNEFISGTLLRKIRSLIQYSLPVSLVISVYKSIISGQMLAQRSFSGVGSFVIFKLTYDLAIWTSVVRAFFGERKSK
jgi:poly-beta-1,6-N-acetyl-D-glucosamine synthase